VRIGVSPILGVKLVDLIIEPFRRINSDVHVIFREMNLAEMTRLLDEGQLECVFGPIDLKAQNRSEWNGVLLFEEPLIFVASGASNRSTLHDSSIALTKISNETFVLVSDACGLTQVTRAIFRRHRYRLNEYPGEAMSYAVLQEWAQLGIGAAILPRSKVLDSTGHQIVGKDEAALTISYHAIWRKQSVQRPEITRLAAYLQEKAPLIAAGVHGFGTGSAMGVQQHAVLTPHRHRKPAKP